MSAAPEQRVQVTDPLIGQRIKGRYDVVRVHAGGGMSVVYAATDAQGQHEVAVKVLDHKGADDPVAVELFLNEARTQSTLDHDNVVAVSDFGRLPDGRPYLVMPMVDGVDVATLLMMEGPQHPERVASLLSGVAAAIDAMHAKGIIHRDIKPENLMCVTDAGGSEAVLVLDFGIAAAALSRVKASAPDPTSGTREFMPPEALVGDAYDEQGDIYALATVAYELITGRLPFVASDAKEFADAKINGDALSLSAAYGDRYPRRLEAVVARGLARQPAKRPHSATQFVHDLAIAARLMPRKPGAPRAIGRSSAYPTLIGPGLGPVRGSLAPGIRRHTERGYARAPSEPGSGPQQSTAAAAARKSKPVAFTSEPTARESHVRAVQRSGSLTSPPSTTQDGGTQWSADSLLPPLATEAAAEAATKGATDRPSIDLAAPPPIGWIEAPAPASHAPRAKATKPPPRRAHELRARLAASAVAGARQPDDATDEPVLSVPDTLRPPPALDIHIDIDPAVRPRSVGRWIGYAALATAAAIALAVVNRSSPSAVREREGRGASHATAASTAAKIAEPVAAPPQPERLAVEAAPAGDDALAAGPGEGDEVAVSADGAEAVAQPARLPPEPERRAKRKRTREPESKATAAAPAAEAAPTSVEKEEPAPSSRATAESLTHDGVEATLAGRFQEASKTLAEAIAVDERYPPAWRARGLVLEQMDRPAEAAKAFRRYLELAPSGAAADAIRARLDALQKPAAGAMIPPSP